MYATSEVPAGAALSCVVPFPAALHVARGAGGSGATRLLWAECGELVTATRPSSSHLREHATGIRDRIPAPRLKSKVRNTVFGLGAVVTGTLFEVTHLFPAWLRIGLILFGGFSISQDLVRQFAGFLPAAVRDLRAAIKGDDK